MPAEKKNKGGRPLLLSDANLRGRYLDALRAGHTRQEAGEIIGIKHYSTIWRYLQANPEFLAEVIEAQSHVVDRALSRLLHLMDHAEKESDQISAAKAVVASVKRDSAKDHTVVEHRHTHELKSGLTADIVELQRKLQERHELAAGTIDVPPDDIEESP